MASNEICLGRHTIGVGRRPFIIAEAGVNHNGDGELAHRLIDAAVEAGADAVKFQTWKTENIVVQGAPTADYQRTQTGDTDQFSMLQSLELDFSVYPELVKHCQDQGITFMSTADDAESLEFLLRLGVPAIKVGSGEVGNLPFLNTIARKGLPTILSTGMSTLGEVERAVDVFREANCDDLVLLHCVSEYPAEISQVNLKAMQTLAAAFGTLVGFSDHTEGITACVAASALGATVLEKHLTLDRSMPGPDHQASLEPAQFKQLVLASNQAHVALGSGVKVPTTGESQIKKVVQRSIVAKRDIAVGECLTMEMLELKRPGTGLSPVYLPLVLGRRLKEDIACDSFLSWGVLD